MTQPIVRPAEQKDVAGISETLTRSIVELCKLDHQDDPKHVKYWLDGKTPEGVAAWLTSESSHLRVTDHDGNIGAVGCFLDDGTISLLYVSPDAQGQGHSAAILAVMEAELAKRDLTEAKLISTLTAQKFYEHHGWQPDGPLRTCYTTDGQPMRKRLGA